MIKHTTRRFPFNPKVGKIYRARITGVGIEKGTAVVRWAIYTPKNRAVKAKK